MTRRLALFALLFSTPLGALLAAQATGPAGWLVLLGGGDRPGYVMDRIVELAGGRSARILVVPVAHPDPAEAAATLTSELELAGAGRVETLSFDHETVDSWESLERVTQASGVFFAGGDQAQLADSLLGTQLLDRLRDLVDRGGVVAGDSAGASVLGTLMVTGPSRPNQDPDRGVTVIRSGAVAIEPGLDLLPGAIVDQHFAQRRRHNRLLTAALEHPELLAIGIDEATAVEVAPNRRLTVLGEGLVAIYDLTWASELSSDRNGNLTAQDISLHLLKSGQTFDLESRQVVE